MTAHLERDVADVASKWVPDTRLGVFEVTVQPGALAGCTTSRDALAALRRIAADARLAADIRLLPDSSVGDEQAAVVATAVAPLLHEPGVSADRVSEALHGEILEVLERRSDTWLRVRVGDGYVAWVHSGYVSLGSPAWAEDWAGRATVRSLGAELRCEGARFRLAVGARAAPDTSCTRPCRAAASSRMTCSPTRRRCGGCGSFSSRCGGWKRPIDETSPLGSHPEGWARHSTVLKHNALQGSAAPSPRFSVGTRRGRPLSL